jgi:hypothetical protein
VRPKKLYRSLRTDLTFKQKKVVQKLLAKLTPGLQMQVKIEYIERQCWLFILVLMPTHKVILFIEVLKPVAPNLNATAHAFRKALIIANDT